MSEEANETDKLDNADTDQRVKYKDKYTFLCSTRWRICIYIFLSFTLLYLHRVNLSLAIVCMVETTGTYTKPIHVNKSEIDSLNISSPENGYIFISNNSVWEDKISNISKDYVTYDVGKTTTIDKVETETNVQCEIGISETSRDWTPELHWKKTDVSLLLSSYFYGCFFTQIPAGTIADIFGGKHIFTVAMLLSAICSLLTPICARTSIILVFVLRIIIGLAGGAFIPAGMSMLNVWATPSERPMMIAVVTSGFLTGSVIAFWTSGLLCVYGFDNGWPSIFYIHGGITLLFTCVWIFDGYSHPSEHPRISKEELEHIRGTQPQATNNKRLKAPWKKLMLSKPLWATFGAHFSFNWSFFTVLINVPLFLKEVLKYDIKSNGLYSALPYVFQLFFSLFCGKLATVIIERQYLGHLATRRAFNSICLFGIAVCLVCAGYVSCEVRHIAVILLCLSCTFAGFVLGGFYANHPEYAGQFAGTAFGITNAAGIVASIVASMIAGLLTPNGLQEEWQLVFYLAAVVNVIGGIVYIMWSDVNLQPWARNQEESTVDGDLAGKLEMKQISSNQENRKSGSRLEPHEVDNRLDLAVETEEMLPLNKNEVTENKTTENQ